MTALTEALCQPHIHSENLTQERCEMSTDAILDLTAVAVVFGSFLVSANWHHIRNAILRTYNSPSRSSALADLQKRS